MTEDEVFQEQVVQIRREPNEEFKDSVGDLASSRDASHEAE